MSAIALIVGHLSPSDFALAPSFDGAGRARTRTVSLGGALAVAVGAAACHTDAKSGETAIVDGSAERGGFLQRRFCDLPGSVQYTAGGVVIVPGGMVRPPNLAFLTLPAGFCAHEFATVGNTRQLRFAPSGELFVASPTRHTTGGGPAGQAAIVVLPDDNGDGFADAPSVFLRNLPSTQGLLFANGQLFYQDDTRIMRVPFRSGDRVAVATPSLAAEVPYYSSNLHWPKLLDQADDGTIYVTNGDDEQLGCDAPGPFRGGVLKLDGSTAAQPVAKGFRNPIALRCLRGKNLCYAVELSRDHPDRAGAGRRSFRFDGTTGFPAARRKIFHLPIFPARIARRSRRRAFRFSSAIPPSAST
jgi:glucose/arabinose dehydrogenase